MLTNEAYNFSEWSDAKLEERLADVLEASEVPHNEPRQSEIARELSYLVFELEWRSK